ncbi:unnamed protein product [Leptidea sinapis]|uniref:Peptidase M12A domain-containing protein n=1 Tax=Leptidea sinapis TaxID=189913 RepID=A0A5E4QL68_9NEOP|nr:unnamed protein product [Leptidea sinapis]
MTSKAIQKKRQDTLEICKIFNEQNHFIEEKGRVKRDTTYLDNPALNDEDLRRVESIVDKMYDDNIDGTKVTYRRRNGVTVKNGVRIGQRQALSETDIEKVSLIYNYDCAERNNEYLLKTCPNVVQSASNNKKVTDAEIQEYFNERLWPYGIINYDFKDQLEFTLEERENIQAVIKHIEKETCIRFRNIGTTNSNEYSGDTYEVDEAFGNTTFSSDELNGVTVQEDKTSDDDNAMKPSPGGDTINEETNNVNGDDVTEQTQPTSETIIDETNMNENSTEPTQTETDGNMEEIQIVREEMPQEEDTIRRNGVTEATQRNDEENEIKSENEDFQNAENNSTRGIVTLR